MLLPHPKDANHKAWLYRLLSAIYDDAFLAKELYFKGGTCAAMLGHLDRFSVDLDFDFMGDPKNLKETRKRMEQIFSNLGLEIKDASKRVPQYFLKYPANSGARNTLKVDVTFPHPRANKYEPKEFVDIGRIIYCQTVETMFANKLVACVERYKKSGSLAGRDVYDIHHFFFRGYRYNQEVIEERHKKPVIEAMRETNDLLEKYVTDELINQDLNALLTPHALQMSRKFLKQETLMFLRDEISRLESKK